MNLMTQDEFVKESERLRQTKNDSFIGCPEPTDKEDKFLFYVNHEEVTEKIPFRRESGRKVTLHDVSEEGLAKFEDAVYKTALKLKSSSDIVEKTIVSNLLAIWSKFHSIESYDASQTNDPYSYAQGMDITFAFYKVYDVQDGGSFSPKLSLLDYFHVLAVTREEILVRFK